MKRFVPKMGLNFNLTAKLMLKFVLNELVLEEHLQTNDKLALLFASQVDASKLTSSKLLSNVEVFQAPALSRLGLDGCRDLASRGRARSD